LTPKEVINDIVGDIPIKQLPFVYTILYAVVGAYHRDSHEILPFDPNGLTTKNLLISAHEATHARRCNMLGVPIYDNLVQGLQSVENNDIWNEERIVSEDAFLYLYKNLDTPEKRKELILAHKAGLENSLMYAKIKYTASLSNSEGDQE